MCSSTRFVMLLSCLVISACGGNSITTFAITPSSFAKLSYAAFPCSFTLIFGLILAITFCTFSGSTNDLQVIVLVPSYTSNITKVLPFFNSLESVLITFPCKATLP